MLSSNENLKEEESNEIGMNIDEVSLILYNIIRISTILIHLIIKKKILVAYYKKKIQNIQIIQIY
jgi:hypothetical protein